MSERQPGGAPPAVDPALLENWDLGEVRQVQPAPHGRMNRVFFVDSDAGRFVIRSYEYLTRSQAEQVILVMRAASSGGVPLPLPLPGQGNEVLIEHGGTLWNLFPRVDGIHPRLSVNAEVEEMGRVLARIHLSLADLTWRDVSPGGWEPGAENIFDRMGVVESAIRAWPDFSAQEEYALGRLAGQREWLAAHPETDFAQVHSLREQIIHGDYQHLNLLVIDAAASGVLDWDFARFAPPEWDLMHALYHTFSFSPVESRRFIESYREKRPVSTEALTRVAELYTLNEANNLFPYYSAYIRGDDHMRHWFKPGGFSPMLDAWRQVGLD